jgi:predicted XRE-type DNA-binding protein
MKEEIIRGSGNVYRDLNMPDADIRQLKAILAAEIIKTLDKKELSVRKAQRLTGVPAADFSRIRTADLERFSSDRLMMILNKLGSRVEVSVRVKERKRETVHA